MSLPNSSGVAGQSRQSPFRRQPSTRSPNTVRASTPTSSPTKPSLLSPARGGSLSPEKTSPFVRRPSQNSQASERPTSPFGRPDSTIIRETPSWQERASSQEPGYGSPHRHDVLPPTPARRFEQTASPSPAPSSPSPFDGTDAIDSPAVQMPSQANLRPAPQRNMTSSTTSTIRQPDFSSARTAVPSTFALKGSNNIKNNVPAPLLRTFRESFEVLDANATGQLNPASLPPVLEQLGLPIDATTLSSFFPPGQAQIMNLATYLDTLSTPYAQLSPPDELAAAFSAFDVDDSGQIDVRELREALLRTLPEPGEANVGARLSERDVDGILQEFAGRRAFGAKGVHAQKSGANGKGEVFRWREFVGNLGGVGTEGKVEAMVA